MLRELQIQNFSILESLQLQFADGFHAISGETGAGKSVLLQALSFVLGAKADPDSIRAGKEEATVVAVFEIENPEDWKTVLEDLNLPNADFTGEFIFRRQLQSSGRSKAYLNDQSISLKTLQSLAAKLVRQVGQHAVYQLFEEKFLLKILDRYGKHEKLLQDYQKCFEAFRQAEQELLALQKRMEASQQQEDFLRFQYEELERAQLRAGEEAELENLRERLKHRVSLAEMAYQVAQTLNEGESSVTDQLSQSLHLMQKASHLDVEFGQWLPDVQNSLEQLQSVSTQLTQYLNQLQEDPAEFDQIETRLGKLHDLRSKYRLDEAGLMARHEELRIQLGELQDFEMIRQEREQAQKDASESLVKIAKELSQSRERVAKKMAQQLQQTLKDLALPHAKVAWKVTPVSEFSQYRREGADQISLWVSFNPGEEMRPMEEIASGGELSRLLLAIDEILLPSQKVPTLIYDEVDAGVGGAVADLIGRKLKKLSTGAQVLCITHLPQIACQAKWQYLVEKKVQNNRTFSEVRLLKNSERVGEIARMLAGFEVTEQAMRHAKELLKEWAA